MNTSRQTVGGRLDLNALRVLHRPCDHDSLRREAGRLAALNLTQRDIGAALGLAPTAVLQLLGDDANA